MSVVTAVLPVVTLVLGYLGTLVTEARRTEREALLADRRAFRQLEIDALREIQSGMIELIHYVNIWVGQLPQHEDSFSAPTGYIAAIHKLDVRRTRQSDPAVDAAVSEFLGIARPLIGGTQPPTDATVVKRLSDASFDVNELVRARFRELGLFVPGSRVHTSTPVLGHERAGRTRSSIEPPPPLDPAT